MQRLLLLVPLAGLVLGGAAACGSTDPAAVKAADDSTVSSADSSTTSVAPTTTSSSPTPTPSRSLKAPIVADTPTPSRSNGHPLVKATPTKPGLPAFSSSVSTVTTAQLGATWHSGCPVAPAALRQLTMTYYGFDGAAHTGTMVVNASYASSVISAFADLYAHRFPIRKMVPVSVYGGSDDESVAADNTAGFNCRAAVNDSGTTSWSMHAYGDAIDVDPVENPYVYDGKVDPPNGAAYANRSDIRPGMAYSGGELVSAFARIGWKWGASFGDYQHFSTNGK